MGHFRKQQITIFPTNTCNLQCVYCVAAKSKSQVNKNVIDINFAKRGIYDYFSDKSKHQIRFYSNGEPTNEISIIKECISYAKGLIEERKSNNIQTEELISEIQTNCYFDEETAIWIAKNINYVWVSIDGWADIQNRYRKSKDNSNSADIILNNLKKIIEIKKSDSQVDSFVGVRITIVNETVDKQIELVEYFKDLGITEICSEPCFKPVDSLGVNGKITLVDIKEYVYNFYEAWKRANELGVNYINSFIVNFDEKVTYACRTCLPTPHLTVDGYVSSCDLGFHGKTNLSSLLFGKYNNNTKSIEYCDTAISKLQSRNCSNIPACKNCDIKEYCGGGCLGRAYHETNDFYGVIDEYCWAIKYLYNKMKLSNITIKHLHP